MVTSCGPEKESCVANQTLKDKRCLVPCTGLYADIADDSFEQNVVKGKMLLLLFHPYMYISYRSSHDDSQSSLWGELGMETE